MGRKACDNLLKGGRGREGAEKGHVMWFAVLLVFLLPCVVGRAPPPPLGAARGLPFLYFLASSHEGTGSRSSAAARDNDAATAAVARPEENNKTLQNLLGRGEEGQTNVAGVPPLTFPFSPPSLTPVP